MNELSPAQERALTKLSTTEPRSPYCVQESIPTLTALVAKGYAKNVTKYNEPGLFYSPRTTLQYIAK